MRDVEITKLSSPTPITDMDAALHNAPSEWREYVTALTREMPHLKFYTRRVREFYVGVDGDPFTLGSVGYGDISGGNKMYVRARSITNKKFSSGSDYHHTLASKDLKTILKHCRTHLRVHTPENLAHYYSDDLRSKVREGTEAVTTRVNRLGGNLFGRHGTMATELRALVNAGYKFNDPSFHADIYEYFDKLAQHEHNEKQMRQLVFVRVLTTWQGQSLQTVQLTPITGAYAYGGSPSGASTTVPIAEADPEFVGRISVLSMLEADTYVDGVGYKVSEDTFYVETSEGRTNG